MTLVLAPSHAELLDIRLLLLGDRQYLLEGERLVVVAAVRHGSPEQPHVQEDGEDGDGHLDVVGVTERGTERGGDGRADVLATIHVGLLA